MATEVVPLNKVVVQLDHEGVDVAEGELQQVKAEHGNFLIIHSITGDLPTAGEKDEDINAVPVFDNLQTLVDLSA